MLPESSRNPSRAGLAPLGLRDDSPALHGNWQRFYRNLE